MVPLRKLNLIERSRNSPRSLGTARGRTESRRELRAIIRREAELLGPHPARPLHRRECVDGPRPCPWAGCRHHLYLEVTPTGSVKLVFPELEVDQIPETCSLDVAEHGPLTLDQVGQALNVTLERARQLEAKTFGRLRKKGLIVELLEVAKHVGGIVAGE